MEKFRETLKVRKERAVLVAAVLKRGGVSDNLAELTALANTELAGDPESTILQTALAILALAKGNLPLGAFIAYFDDAEIDEILENYLSWSELYKE